MILPRGFVVDSVVLTKTTRDFHAKIRGAEESH